jgi:hypothetical protein
MTGRLGDKETGDEMRRKHVDWMKGSLLNV